MLMNAEEQSNMDNEIMNENLDQAAEMSTADAANEGQEVLEADTSKKSNKRILQGVVVSNKPDKSIVIKVVRQVAHPLYKKYYRKSKKFMAHDEKNECNVGDVVRIRECRPISKRKTWELVEIVERAK